MSDLFPDKFEVIELNGCIERNDGSNWIAVEGEKFWDALYDWLDSQGVSFGGTFGGIPAEGTTTSSKHWEELKALRSENKQLKADLEEATLRINNA